MAAISVFDIFKIGIGPSSSHTVGPMNAARAFIDSIPEVADIGRMKVTLHGSLAWTGKGHGTDSAIILGLAGHKPDTIDPTRIDEYIEAVRVDQQIDVPGAGKVTFNPDTDIEFNYEEELPRHTNGMHFRAEDTSGGVVAEDNYYSLGGGFIARADEPEVSACLEPPKYVFKTASDLLRLADKAGLSIARLVYENERQWRSEADIDARVAELWTAMQACIERGLETEGVLPGRIQVSRRAPKLYRRLTGAKGAPAIDTMTWVNAFAIAVNEENAAGGRVVTSPTNGAAGIIPAVMMYYSRFVDGSSERGIKRFLMTAGAIGILYKINASISGAEMGCQGEVGVACSMAAAGLVAALGGDNRDVEQAAEIGMEHNLGLTCDPIGGLVQIPCIERNAMGAIKAINAATLAMHGDGTHKVSLDQVIETMRQTGIDMSSSYKETSKGGLAVNVPEC
jgi:L-serine dehydratase